MLIYKMIIKKELKCKPLNMKFKRNSFFISYKEYTNTIQSTPSPIVDYNISCVCMIDDYIDDTQTIYFKYKIV